MRKILIADDEPYILNILDFSLGAEGYTVVQAVDGQAALSLAGQHEPDLIILDVMMPGIDGYEACKRLKEDPQTKSIPVVLLTARNSLEDRRRGEEVGADGYMTKPFSPQRLLDLVQEHLGVVQE